MTASMPLHQALVVCDQASPMPSVAHDALVTLRTHLLPLLAYEQFVNDYWRGRRREDAGSGSGEPYHEELRQLYIMSVGLAGEVGEVCELLKKDVRDGHLDRRELCLELGDVLYYLVKLAHHFDLSLGTIMRVNREKLTARRESGLGKAGFVAAHVMLDAQPVDWNSLAAKFPPSVADDLRRAAGFLEGCLNEASIIAEEDAQRIARVLRALAAAGEARAQGVG